MDGTSDRCSVLTSELPFLVALSGHSGSKQVFPETLGFKILRDIMLSRDRRHQKFSWKSRSCHSAVIRAVFSIWLLKEHVAQETGCELQYAGSGSFLTPILTSFQSQAPYPIFSGCPTTCVASVYKITTVSLLFLGFNTCGEVWTGIQCRRALADLVTHVLGRYKP